jgi:hypothetical protein
MNDWISLGVAIVILVVASAIFIRISRKARRGGSGATVTGFGALYVRGRSSNAPLGKAARSTADARTVRQHG